MEPPYPPGVPSQHLLERLEALSLNRNDQQASHPVIPPTPYIGPLSNNRSYSNNQTNQPTTIPPAQYSSSPAPPRYAYCSCRTHESLQTILHLGFSPQKAFHLWQLWQSTKARNQHIVSRFSSEYSFITFILTGIFDRPVKNRSAVEVIAEFNADMMIWGIEEQERERELMMDNESREFILVEHVSDWVMSILMKGCWGNARRMLDWDMEDRMKALELSRLAQAQG
ncbi:hypothetical protein OCU04_008753 [Sclerotinia nivalis]|uniref:Uncharacterized protein n=1 Tax=Sclerotinia nivalis TaxID=352851 RepID=A0A9X0AGH7_9HELO|nr:hypothetical protein OCU04_008753 [Sclerotinia nivalis]